MRLIRPAGALAVAVAAVAGGVLVVGGLPAAGQDLENGPATPIEVSDSASDFSGATPNLLACTGADESTNFTVYSLGSSFGRIDATTVIRRCDKPYPGEPIRANFVSYIYGSCEVPVDPATGLADGGCAPPLEIQTWPACERTRADYSLDGGPYPEEDLGLLRGVPAARFDGGERLELYAGTSTIVIFADDEATLDAAVKAVRAEPTDRSLGAPVGVADSTDLPQPPKGATTGALTCG